METTQRAADALRAEIEWLCWSWQDADRRQRQATFSEVAGARSTIAPRWTTPEPAGLLAPGRPRTVEGTLSTTARPPKCNQTDGLIEPGYLTPFTSVNIDYTAAAESGPNLDDRRAAVGAVGHGQSGNKGDTMTKPYQTATPEQRPAHNVPETYTVSCMKTLGLWTAGPLRLRAGVLADLTGWAPVALLRDCCGCVRAGRLVDAGIHEQAHPGATCRRHRVRGGRHMAHPP